MARPDKAAAVAEITEAFRGSSAAVLTEYRGLTVAQLKELRRALATDAEYKVVKNTLTKIAAREAGLETLEPLLEGPSAIAFVTGDPVAVAKGLRDFMRDHPLLVVKGGVVEGNPVDAAEIRKLADLESRDVLLAKLAGAMNASLSRAAAMFQAPLAQAARLAAALQAKAEQDPSVLAGTASTEAAPATDTAEAAPATDEGETAPAAAEAPTEEVAEQVAEQTDSAAPTAEEAADAADEAAADDETS